MRILLFLILSLPVLGANLLPNSSFEVGGRSGWSWGSTDAIWNFPDAAVSSAAAFHGLNSWGISGNGSTNANAVMSSGIRLQPNTEYTVSVYARNSVAGSYNIILGMENAWESQGPASSSVVFQANSTGWTRTNLTFTTTTNIAKCVYRFYGRVSVSSYPNLTVRFDAFQLETGAVATAYAPASTLELGLPHASSVYGNTFFTNETVSLPIRIWNEGSAATPTVQWQEFDFYGAPARDGTLVVNAGSGLTETNIDLSTTTKGTRSLRAWIRYQDGSLNESQFSVLGLTNALSSPTAGLFGLHVKGSTPFARQARRAGFTWQRTLSGTGMRVGLNPARWTFAEPTDGNFVFDDSSVSVAIAEGLNPLLVVGEEVVNTPAYALSGGLPVINPYWTNFVDTIVRHYGDIGVRHWEIWNEPEGEGGLGSNPEVWVDLATNALAIIKGINTNHIVMGPAVSAFYYNNNPWYGSNTLGPLWAGPKLDLISHHAYYGTDRSGDWRSRKGVEAVAAANGYGEAWMTEAGARLWTGYKTILFDESYTDDGSISPIDANDQRSNFIRGQWFAKTFCRMAGVTTKSFWYDGRSKGSLEYPITYSPFEWDGSLRPMGSMASAFIALFEEAVYGGTVEFGGDIDDNGYIFKEVETYTFLKGSDVLLAAFVNHRTNVYTLTADGIAFDAFDAVGNPVSTNGGVKISFLRPAYLRAPSSTTNAMLAAVDVAASSDAENPVVTIDTAPVGPANQLNHVRFRWSGSDNVGLQYFGTVVTNALQFRWKLGSESFSAWSETNAAYYSEIPLEGSFTVEVRDPSGNTAFASSEWSGEPPSGVTATANSATVGTITVQ